MLMANVTFSILLKFVKRYFLVPLSLILLLYSTFLTPKSSLDINNHINECQKTTDIHDENIF